MKNPIRCMAFVSVTSVFLLSYPARAEDWLHFRGPHQNGVANEKDWAAEFPASGPKIAWSKEVGIGASSMTVAGEKVLTMGNQNDADVVWCLSAEEGSVIWKFSYPCKFEKRMFEGGTSATPTIDGDRVYTLSYDGQLHCLKLADGAVIWKVNLLHDFGGKLSRWKYACSPLVFGNLLILDVGGAENSTLALDKMTGKKVWGVGKDQAGYASPVPYREKSGPAVLVFKGKAMLSHDLKTGRELWRIPWETNYDVNASSPFVVGDKLFISSGYSKGKGALFQLNGNTPRQLWVNNTIKTKMSSCIPLDGAIYAITEKGGKLQCINPKDGKPFWEEDDFSRFGSITAADGKIIALTEKGELKIVAADTSRCRILASGKVLDQRAWVYPVIANGRIYCKDNKGTLVCVDVRKEIIAFEPTNDTNRHE